MAMTAPTDPAQRFNTLQTLAIKTGCTSMAELSKHLGYRVTAVRYTCPRLDLALQLSTALGWSMETMARMVLGEDRDEDWGEGQGENWDRGEGRGEDWDRDRGEGRSEPSALPGQPRPDSPLAPPNSEGAAAAWHVGATDSPELRRIARRFAEGAFAEAAALADRSDQGREYRAIDRAWAGIWRARALLRLGTRHDLAAARSVLVRARGLSRRLPSGSQLLINTLRMECLTRSGRYPVKRVAWLITLLLESVRDLDSCHRSPEEIAAIGWCCAIGSRLVFDLMAPEDHRDHFIALFTTKLDEIADMLNSPALRRELVRLDQAMPYSHLPAIRLKRAGGAQDHGSLQA